VQPANGQNLGEFFAPDDVTDAGTLARPAIGGDGIFSFLHPLFISYGDSL
jgi:hypothetical protein